MKKLALFALLLWVFFPPVSLLSAPGDEHWDNQFNWPGPNSPFALLSLAQHNGRLYAGDLGVASTDIQQWDGVQWSVIGLFYGSLGTSINDMAFAGDTLYAAGAFTNVNGITVSNLAKWDGTSWSAIGLNGTARCLALEGNNLYVGGSFTNPATGGVVMTNIGYWDGSAWHALGNGLGRVSGSTFYVRAVTIKNGLVYASGAFTNSGSQFLNNVAVWNGSNWSGVGGGLNGVVNTMLFNGSDLYVGGSFTNAVLGDAVATNIARWDGANWTALGNGVTGLGVQSLAVFNNLVYAAGSFASAGGVKAINFAAWDGSSWSSVGGGVSATATRVFSTGTNICVSGNFILAGGYIAAGIAAWDGTNWSTFGTPGRVNGVYSTVRSVTGAGTDLYIGGGTLSAAGHATATHIARFDSVNWYPIGPGLNSNVVAIAVAGTNIYTAGDFTGDGDGSGPLAYHMAHWDGTHWSALNNTAFTNVTGLAMRSNDLFIAGYFSIPGADGTSIDLTRWDGTNFWNLLRFSPFTSFLFGSGTNGITAIGVQDSDIYIGGDFSISECNAGLTVCTNCYNVLRFDGTYAHIVGSGLNSNVTAIAAMGTNVYFAGEFTQAGGFGGPFVSKIARWNGRDWFDVGGGIIGTGAIKCLAAVGTNLYAAGTFTNIGGITASNIAKWNGAGWSALGSGISGTTPGVNALYVSGSDLYVVGSFTFAGGKPSYYIAHWNDQANFNRPQISPIRASNGQFQMRLAGVAGLTNIVQATTNFTVWTSILTNSTGIYDFTDPDSPGYPFRFYRAVLGP